MSFTARAPYPSDAKPHDVPSFAEERIEDGETVVILTHPSGDVTHPSVVAAVQRYLAKPNGWTVRLPQMRRAA